MSLKDDILKAAKADAIPKGSAGLWAVRKWAIAKPIMAPHPRSEGRVCVIPPGSYTNLHCYTTATLHEFGELVMHDIPVELNTHLDFMLRAYGRVLITGLGLGCVVRGCLENPRVADVTVIERDADVLKLVEPYMPKTPRLKIVKADALKWTKRKDIGHFDCAWHDLWTNDDKKEPHLALWHAELISNMANKAAFQGAWEFPRDQRRLWSETLRVKLI